MNYLNDTAKIRLSAGQLRKYCAYAVTPESKKYKVLASFCCQCDKIVYLKSRPNWNKSDQNVPTISLTI